MAAETMITVNNVALPTPSGFTWGKADISAADAGRTEDTLMHKNRVGEKRTLHLEWQNKDPATTAQILQAFEPEYVSVRYPDALSGNYETRTFYCGDMSAPVRYWWAGHKRYQLISLDITER